MVLPGTGAIESRRLVLLAAERGGDGMLSGWRVAPHRDFRLLSSHWHDDGDLLRIFLQLLTRLALWELSGAAFPPAFASLGSSISRAFQRFKFPS
jgi:hypothetical protein